MADWFMLAIIHAAVGYEALTLGFIAGTPEGAADGMLIIAFLAYSTAILLLALSYFGEVSGKPVDISVIVLILVGGRLTLFYVLLLLKGIIKN